MTFKTTLAAGAAAVALLSGAQTARADAHLSEITIGYFLEWPMPFQYGKVNGAFEEAMGVDINWVSFDTGVAMSAAMASGDVQMAISQGIPPFVIATSAGQDLEIINVAVSYSENDNCVVSSALEIDASNVAEELPGRRVAVPIGSAAHYGFLRQMDHFGIDVASLEVVDMAPPDASAAFAQGSLDMFCGWGASLRRGLESGNVLLTGAEKEAAGILVFDVTSAPSSFVAENPEMVEAYLATYEAMNEMWRSGENHDEMLQVIAQDAGMDLEGTEATMATFTFPTIEEQLSEKWLGGGVQTFMDGVADVFVEAGGIPSRLDTYDNTVDTELLSAIQ